MYLLTGMFDPAVGPLVRATITDPFQLRPDDELPRSEQVTLLLDTGATDTALKGHIIDRLRLTPLGFHSVHSFGPELATTLQYSADLELHMNKGVMREFVGLEVCRFSAQYDKIDGVIGRDILRLGRFVLDGRKGEFTLEF